MDRADSLSDRRQVLSGPQFSGVVDDDGIATVLFLQERAREHEALALYWWRQASRRLTNMAGVGLQADPDAALD